MAKKRRRYLEVSEYVIDYIESPGSLEPADAERCSLQLLYSVVLALSDIAEELEHIRGVLAPNVEERMERIEVLEQRVKEEKAWAQHREDMYVAVRKQLRQAGAIKPHEEITVRDAIKRLLRQVPARAEEQS